MYEVTVIDHFAAAHNLLNFKGKCEALHGHNWKIEVTVRGAEVDEAGMLMDFAELKRMTAQALAELDHAYLNELPAFKGQSPSSERIARRVYDRVSQDLSPRGLQVVRVSAWESESSRATYLGPEG